MADLTLDRLLELEHDGWNALCSSRGGAFYGRMMTDDGLMVLVNGMVLDRDGVVASLDDAPPWASYRLSEARIVPISSDASALVYRATATRDGEPPFTALMSSVYRHTADGPRLVLYQQTAI